MGNLICLFYVMFAIFLGEWVSRATKSWIPSMLVTALMFLIGYWTFFPKNLIEQASYSKSFITICIGLLLVHLGTLMSVKKLLKQWKAVCIAVLGMMGSLIFTLTIGLYFFGHATVFATVPTLTGGLVGAALMTQGLQASGITAIVSYPVVMFIIHHIVSFPLISVMLKKEGRRLQSVYAADSKSTQQSISSEKLCDKKQHRRLAMLDGQYDTPAFLIFKVTVIAIVSFWIGNVLHNAINVNILCLLFGVVAHTIGFLPDNVLQKTGVFNWLMYGLIAYILAGLNSTTPQTLIGIFLPIITLIVLGLMGMFLVSILLAKPMGMHKEMAFACALTALCGFPADYILTDDVVKNLTADINEQEFLLDNMLPKMLVGGFATVSIASVFVVSIFLKLI
ncbi:hypothetical protein [Convivina intestini]|uniref:hypothetical protein n=1 Tax=Convivina intestini TaxID=1505726 RepID=UPI002010522A|nr:hypothetical protein [Convivina intestini]CAH1855846.1 hypothetical protein R078131_01284 [Convivina intestini]